MQRVFIRKITGLAVGAVLVFLGAAGAETAGPEGDRPAGEVAKAEELYRATQYGPALALLDRDSSLASELDLIGRIYYMQGDYRLAVDFLTKALEADPKNGKYADWLGRAWGRRAESGGLSAAGYASKARGYFEQAVQLDPKNEEALSDIFDYYLQAPGFLGGGVGKAAKVADEIGAFDPADGDAKRASIAEKKKDYSRAEDLLRRAVEAAPKQVGYRVALAEFFARRGRDAESDALFAKVEQDFPNVPKVWFAHAGMLIRQKRNLSDAKRLLEKYLQATITPDDPPKRDAEKLLERASAGA